MPVGKHTIFEEMHYAYQATTATSASRYPALVPGRAIVSEFSTRSYDEFDIFTNPRIRRATIIQ